MAAGWVGHGINTTRWGATTGKWFHDSSLNFKLNHKITCIPFPKFKAWMWICETEIERPKVKLWNNLKSTRPSGHALSKTPGSSPQPPYSSSWITIQHSLISIPSTCKGRHLQSAGRLIYIYSVTMDRVGLQQIFSTCSCPAVSPILLGQGDSYRTQSMLQIFSKLKSTGFYLTPMPTIL